MPYAISGGHQKTIEAAEIILRQGGNAVDAAIAAYLVSFIAEPCMASIGAGGFAMINNGSDVRLIDFFCQTPISKTPVERQDFYPITVDFGNTTEDFHVGKGSIAVPGAVAGIFKMHELYRSLPISVIAEPAIQWAKEGIQIDRFQAYDLTLLESIFAIAPKGKELFFGDDGNLKKEGDSIAMHGYADFLDALVIEGRDLFYKGEISAKISADLAEGGHLNRTDFEQYEARVRKPIHFTFMDHEVHTAGFPSVGGMILSSILNGFQDDVSGRHLHPLTMDHFQQLVKTFGEVQKLDSNPVKLAAHLFNQFGIQTPAGDHRGSKWGGTSHFNVVDRNGMTVSLTTSIGEGSGYFVEGTDMQMNNMLGEEALMPNGFHNWTSNCRLQSMMSPTIITNNRGNTLKSLGSGGAGRIPYALAQSLIYSLYFNQNPQQSVDLPRIHLKGNIVECESGFEAAELELPNLNVWDSSSLFFGGVNSVTFQKGRYVGAADQRRYGSVIEE